MELAVTIDGVEGLVGVGVAVDVVLLVAVTDEYGFGPFEAQEMPSGGDDLLEDEVFEGSLGIEFGLVGGEEGVEFVLFFGADVETAAEAMFGGVAGGGGFALGGLGTGGLEGVGLIGGDLSGGRHGGGFLPN